jgi:hypothetical protein
MPERDRVEIQVQQSGERCKELGKVVIRQRSIPDAVVGHKIHRESQSVFWQKGYHHVVAMTLAQIVKLERPAAKVERHLLLERYVGWGKGGIAPFHELRPGASVSDDRCIAAQGLPEYRRSRCVIGMVVTVHDR